MSNPSNATLIISGEPGSIFDSVGRVLSPTLERAMGGSLAVSNVGDSSGAGGAEAGAAAPKDGNTLLLCNKGAVTSHPHTSKSYKTTDFEPLCQVAEAPIAIAVKAGGKYDSLKSLMDAAKSGQDVSFSTPNPYHTQRLALAGFAARQEVKFKYVQIPGSNAVAIKNLVQGVVDFAFLAAHNLVESRNAGDIRILGVAHPTRVPFLPDDPTFQEQGYDLVTAIWLGLFTSAGAPPDAIERDQAAAEKTATDPEVIKGIADVHMVPAYIGRAAFARKVAADTEFHLGILRQLGAL